MSGARCVGTLLHEMKRRGRDCRFGVISMCIGLLLSLSLRTHVRTLTYTHTHKLLRLRQVFNAKKPREDWVNLV